MKARACCAHQEHAAAVARAGVRRADGEAAQQRAAARPAGRLDAHGAGRIAESQDGFGGVWVALDLGEGAVGVAIARQQVDGPVNEQLAAGVDAFGDEDAIAAGGLLRGMARRGAGAIGLRAVVVRVQAALAHITVAGGGLGRGDIAHVGESAKRLGGRPYHGGVLHAGGCPSRRLDAHDDIHALVRREGDYLIFGREQLAPALRGGQREREGVRRADVDERVGVGDELAGIGAFGVIRREDQTGVHDGSDCRRCGVDAGARLRRDERAVVEARRHREGHRHRDLNLPRLVDSQADAGDLLRRYGPAVLVDDGDVIGVGQVGGVAGVLERVGEGERAALQLCQVLTQHLG